MIANEFDLGSAGLLYRKPLRYAKFLAQELATFNSDWMLVVMPNGYGIYHCLPKKRAEGYSDPCEGNAATAADAKLLASLPTRRRAARTTRPRPTPPCARWASSTARASAPGSSSR